MLIRGAGFIFGGVAAASFLLGTACGVCALTALLYIKKKKVCDCHGTQKSENKLEVSENMAYETIRFPISTSQVIQR
jgi:hypothetical protein